MSNEHEQSGTQLDLSPILCWSSEKARSWAFDRLSELAGDRRVVAIVGLGSAIRVANHPGDVDMLVIFDGDKPSVSPPPIDVDIRLYDSEKLDLLVQQGNDLLGWALTFGEVLFERDGFWSRLRSRWQGRIPIPSIQDAIDRAKRAEELHAELVAAGDVDAAAEQRLTKLTHVARAHLLKAGVYPASRPELPDQLRRVNEGELAEQLQREMEKRTRAAGV